VPKIGYVTIPAVHVPSKQIFPELFSRTVTYLSLCFCLFLFRQGLWSTLCLLRSVLSWVEFHWDVLAQDLIQSSVFTSASSGVLSSALVQEQSDILQGSCTWRRRPWLRGV